MPSSNDPDVVASLVSAQRFGSYLSAAGGDRDQAVALYQWNVALSAACFEAFHYVEVIVRNAIDREMRVYHEEEIRLIPWFLVQIVSKHQSSFEENIEKVRRRLRDQDERRDTRDQIMAGVDFGFWTALLHSEHEEMWRHALHKAFPHSSGKRKDVVAALEALRIFRNRLAHHDSLLAVDIPFRLSQMGDVVGWVAPEAKKWLTDVERVSTVNAARPVARRDTVVVAASDAWPLYRQIGAYLCQPGRAFQSVDYLAFYADREIKPEIARILRRVDNVDWSDAEVNRLRGSASKDDLRLADVISQSRKAGWKSGRYQMFDLTRPGDAGHITLPKPIPHCVTGKGSAFTQGQRYTVCHALKNASSTAQLN